MKSGKTGQRKEVQHDPVAENVAIAHRALDLRAMPYILKEDTILPIVAWIGPPADMIRPEIMRSMREAGFTVSLAELTDEQMLPALEVAHAAGMRLLIRSLSFDLGRKSYEEGRSYRLSEAQQRKLRDAVREVKDHPGLYGYYVHDEPNHSDYDWIAAVIRAIEELDTYHMCYVNHNAPIIQGGYGANTQEALWKDWIRKTAPRYLSYDHYPIEQKPQNFIESLGPVAAHAFGEIVVKPSYFSALDFARAFCTVLEIPLWAFTCSVPHWSYPTPTEGHIRFQLMCDLAYGARGLQYFTYWGDEALVRSDGTPTPTWALAKKVNADLHALWKKLRPLRSIGVHHTGPLWPGVTPPMLTPIEAWGMDHLGAKFHCVGDPAVLGLFDDSHGNMYILAVNRNPVRSASISFDPSLDDAVPHKWVPLRPGEGKLFKVPEKGPVTLA